MLELFSFLLDPNSDFCFSLQRVAFKWDIEALPTFIFLKRGQKSHRIVGTDRAALLRKIEELKTPAAAASTA